MLVVYCEACGEVEKERIKTIRVKGGKSKMSTKGAVLARPEGQPAENQIAWASRKTAHRSWPRGSCTTLRPAITLWRDRAPHSYALSRGDFDSDDRLPIPIKSPKKRDQAGRKMNAKKIEGERLAMQIVTKYKAENMAEVIKTQKSVGLGLEELQRAVGRFIKLVRVRLGNGYAEIFTNARERSEGCPATQRRAPCCINSKTIALWAMHSLSRTSEAPMSANTYHTASFPTCINTREFRARVGGVRGSSLGTGVTTGNGARGVEVATGTFEVSSVLFDLPRE